MQAPRCRYSYDSVHTGCLVDATRTVHFFRPADGTRAAYHLEYHYCDECAIRMELYHNNWHNANPGSIVTDRVFEEYNPNI